MLQKAKEKYNQKVYEQYKDCLNDISDLFGDGYDGMSNLFYLCNKRYLHWLDNDPEIAVSEKEILFRRKFYKVLQKIGPSVLKCTQVFENRRLLDDPASNQMDEGIVLPNKPVIFVPNHGFHDDVLASVLAARRHAYPIVGSLPLQYNTFDGFASALVGGIVVNRNNKNSRSHSLEKSLKVLEYGTDLLLYPEGGWNKTSERIVLDLWKGVYDISLAARCEVVPIVHYVRDAEVLNKKNIIHTVVDDPIKLYEMPMDEALTYLRDVLASWQYKMMERYGKSTREVEMKGFDTADEKWHAHLKERMKGVARYDSNIEKHADYRPKSIVRPEDAFRAIAQIPDSHITAKNARMILEARKLVAERDNCDFQRLY